MLLSFPGFFRSVISSSYILSLFFSFATSFSLFLLTFAFSSFVLPFISYFLYCLLVLCYSRHYSICRIFHRSLLSLFLTAFLPFSLVMLPIFIISCFLLVSLSSLSPYCLIFLPVLCLPSSFLLISWMSFLHLAAFCHSYVFIPIYIPFHALSRSLHYCVISSLFPILVVSLSSSLSSTLLLFDLFPSSSCLSSFLYFLFVPSFRAYCFSLPRVVLSYSFIF